MKENIVNQFWSDLSNFVADNTRVFVSNLKSFDSFWDNVADWLINANIEIKISAYFFHRIEIFSGIA